MGPRHTITESAINHEVRFPVRDTSLGGLLDIPPAAEGIVLFVNGTGSGRFNPRNQFVAERLRQSGLATLQIDLLTPEEELNDDAARQLRFDIRFLAGRLCDAVDWLSNSRQTRQFPIGVLAANTGAGAALVAAARAPIQIKAVVSRGGRPDLAGDSLRRVACPTLLIVGGNDGIVIDLNHHALAELAAPKKQLVVVPAAGQLFEEPGTLEQVADLAASWLTSHLSGGTPAAPRSSPSVGNPSVGKDSLAGGSHVPQST